MRSRTLGWTLTTACLFWAAAGIAQGDPVLIGANSRLAPSPRIETPRYITFRPDDGATVRLNPPRISWPYLPEVRFPNQPRPAGAVFTLQIAPTRDFAQPAVEVVDTPYNFYSFLPELRGPRTWYWRVKYHAGTPQEVWSQTRSFTLAPDARVWDRSGFGALLAGLKGHPRMLFRREDRKAFLELRRRNPEAGQIAEWLIEAAEDIQKQDYYRHVPEDDLMGYPRGHKFTPAETAAARTKIGWTYRRLAKGLAAVGFAYLLTGEERFADFKPRLLRMASWPPGGTSAPEGSSPIYTGKGNDHVPFFLAQLYDWFYDEWTPAERDALRRCLEWRIAATVNHYSWRANGGRRMTYRSVAVTGYEHHWENLMYTIPAAMAIADESPIAREALEMGLHYLTAVTKPLDPDGPFYIGAGYANGIMETLMQTVWYCHLAMPELCLDRNPVYERALESLARLTPLGIGHSSFGSSFGTGETAWLGRRLRSAYLVAMLTGSGEAMYIHRQTTQRLTDLPGGAHSARFWNSMPLTYAVRLGRTAPESRPLKGLTAMYPSLGWVTAGSKPAVDYGAFDDAVHIIFRSSPVGGVSHAFRAQNGFEIHAYGSTIATGGYPPTHWSHFARSAVSHNTVLVNGHGQETTAGRREFRDAPPCGRIIAFQEGDGYVYWAGDATGAYTEDVGLARFVRHVLFVNNEWFAIYDELAMRDDAEPARFQWLYHITPPSPLAVDRERFTVGYTVGQTRVHLQHLAHVDELTFENRRDRQGMLNPLTGEDHRPRAPVTNPQLQVPDQHHLWISHVKPRRRMEFFAVIIPHRRDEAAPVVAPLGDAAVRVLLRGNETTVAFGRGLEADINVDTAAVTK